MSTLKVNNLTDLGADAVVTDGVIVSSALPAGSIIAVKHALKTDTFSSSVTASDNVAVTDLSITHEVANASNKLMISAFFGAAASTGGLGQVGIAVHDGTSLIGIGDTSGSRTRVSAGGLITISTSTNVNIVTMPSITFVHTPGAGSKTYTVRAINIDSSTRTLFVNRTEQNSDFAFVPVAASGFVIQEVAG